MTRYADLPRCGMPMSRLSKEGRLTEAPCRNPMRSGERRCWKHLDLFKWAATERKVREKARAKATAKVRGWSLERLAALREDRQLDLFVWGDAYDDAIQQAIRSHVDTFVDRPVMPDADAPDAVWDRYFVAAETHRRDETRRTENFNHRIATASAAAERAVLEHGWPGWNTLRWLVYERDGGICFVCDCEVPFEACELGHLQDRMMGGSDRPDNVVVMCITCNRLRKPLHATVEDAREWAAICREQFRHLRQRARMPDDEFWARWSSLGAATREQIVEQALTWPDQVEQGLAASRRRRHEQSGPASSTDDTSAGR